MTNEETLKLALEALERVNNVDDDCDILSRDLANFVVDTIDAVKEALASEQEQGEPVTTLPDGSAFGVMSFPLPDDHWLYAPNEYRDGEYEPIDLPKPILTHALRESVVAAVRYAVRGATMRGKETDFDPDALVQNAVYALCGPFTKSVSQSKSEPLTLEYIDQHIGADEGDREAVIRIVHEVEAAHGITKE